jgi:hypothetical protein
VEIRSACTFLVRIAFGEESVEDRGEIPIQLHEIFLIVACKYMNRIAHVQNCVQLLRY